MSRLLVLTAPSGMSQDDRKAWLHAAREQLGDVCVGDLEDAARDAGNAVDHPAKIVPAIRKALAGRYQPSAVTIERPEPPMMLPRDDVQADAERREVAELMAGLRKKLEANCG